MSFRSSPFNGHVIVAQCTLFTRLFVSAIIFLTTTELSGDETHLRYFEGLRQRRLYHVAESEAISRLEEPSLSIPLKTEFSIELSRALAEHAGFVPEDQRSEFWQRARLTIRKLLDEEPANPRGVFLEFQIACVSGAEGEWLRAEREVRLFDEPLVIRAIDVCTMAIDQCQAVEKKLTDPSFEAHFKGNVGEVPKHYEFRTLLHEVRWQLGASYRNRAELFSMESKERAADLFNADKALTRAIGGAEEPLKLRAKVLQAACRRIMNEPIRSSQLLTEIEKTEPKLAESILNEISVERLNLLIQTQRPADAVELLLKIRSQRHRLTGEMWFLQLKSLILLREIALKKNQETLAIEFVSQIETTIDRCEDQVAGYWGRRCRQLWENAKISEKFGAELYVLMQQARADFVAGRIQMALTRYSSAEKLAAESGQNELAMELGATRASILLDEKRFDEASSEFLRLCNMDSMHPNSAKMHLLGTWCLGRMYDENRTQQRREIYTEELDRHLKVYSTHVTVNDAFFLKAQFEEQRLQATRALPLYLKIETNHPKFLEAMAGAARCYDMIFQRMTERGIVTEEFEREAIDRLSKVLLDVPAVEKWNVPLAEVSLHLASILLSAKCENDSQFVSPKLNENRTEQLITTISLNRCEQAEKWLECVRQIDRRRDWTSDEILALDRVRQLADPLYIVALVRNHKISKAEPYLNALSSRSELQFVIDRLASRISLSHGDSRILLAGFQLQAIDRISPHRDQLSREEIIRLDRSLIQACLLGGSFAKGIALAQDFADHHAKVIELQREIAELCTEAGQVESFKLAKQCWRRIESQAKAGTFDWLTARLGVLSCCVRLKQFEEAEKLLKVTKVLYPEFGGAVLREKFELVEKQLIQENRRRLEE